MKRFLALLLAFALLAAPLVAALSASNGATRHRVCTALSAQAKAYYTGDYSYAALSALSGRYSTDSYEAAQNNPLYTALYTLMDSTHTNRRVTYAGYGSNALATYWEKTDAQNGSDSYYYFYTDIPASDAYQMNREHVWPKSRASFYQKNGGSDLHHLRPSISTVNMKKSNHTFGNVVGLVENLNTATIGGVDVAWIGSRNGTTYFEVRDNIKGDVARILLYVYVRWQQPNLFSAVTDPDKLPAPEADDYGTVSSNYVVEGNTGLPVIESLDVLLDWMESDPVDCWEMERNDLTQDVQGNRNVFIDYPEYAWLLFDQELPAEMQTPSGEAKNGAPSYTLTAVSSNTAYGTVSLSGKTITAAPKTGYQIDDTTPYTVSPAGAATVTRSGNVFTVSNLTSNCTVTIHFAVKVCTHEHTTTERREATCTEGGYERTVCLDCGMELAGMSEPALGHDYRPSVVAPTCTAKGYTLHTCSRCGENYKNAYTDALGHDYVLVASTPSTCTTAGQASYRCTRCGDTYEVALALAAHDYKETVVPPTCTEKGYTLHTCSRCGESYQDAYTDALGHSYKDGKCTVCGVKAPPQYEDFKDLPANAWYKESVGYALANGLMNGTGDGIFQPDGALTRAMLVTILYRSEGEPSVDGLKNPFQDVADGQWYTKAVVWAADKGIVNGTSETTFDPDANITREQIAAILHRYAGKPETKGDLASFPDAATVSDYAKTAMAWTVEKGIIGGSDGKLDPRSNATRAQVAAILMRYLKLTENRPL